MRHTAWGLGLVVVGCLWVGAQSAAQPSVGRGARDPLQPEVIVGSEGKGMFTGAGIPPGNTPIFAARDCAVPDGIDPLPSDIFRTSTRIARCGAILAITAATRRSGSSRSGALTRCR
jgi:hypothetical protein